MNIYLKVILTSLFFALIIFIVTYITTKQWGTSLGFSSLSFIGNFIYDYSTKLSDKKYEKRMNSNKKDKL